MLDKSTRLGMGRGREEGGLHDHLTPNFPCMFSPQICTKHVALISATVVEDLKLFGQIQLYRCLEVRGNYS